MRKRTKALALLLLVMACTCACGGKFRKADPAEKVTPTPTITMSPYNAMLTEEARQLSRDDSLNELAGITPTNCGEMTKKFLGFDAKIFDDWTFYESKFEASELKLIYDTHVMKDGMMDCLRTIIEKTEEVSTDGIHKVKYDVEKGRIMDPETITVDDYMKGYMSGTNVWYYVYGDKHIRVESFLEEELATLRFIFQK
jgi:hypothetical protein